VLKQDVGVVLVAGCALLTAGCSWLSPAEEYRQEEGRTVYRSADHTPPDPELSTSVPPKKVPGE
jgi:hypothetical protein